MPPSTTDGALAGVVLVSAALVLLAPLLGRAGWELAADVCMGLAAGGGLLSFALAAVHTHRAARRRSRGRSGRELT